MYFLLNSFLMKTLENLDLLAITISCLGHDVGHPALTNRYLNNSKDPLIFEYNECSVLENLHCAMTFELMESADCNILSNLDMSAWFILRKLVIDMILSTDMTRHFEILGKFRTRALLLADLDLMKNEDKNIILCVALKCADVGYMGKNMDLHMKWTSLAREELFRQGDLEMKQGLAISMYCDRNNPNIPKSSLGLIVNICMPLFEVWGDYLGSQIIIDTVLGQLKTNLKYWENCNKDRTLTTISKNVFTEKDRKKQYFRRQSEK